MNFIAIDPPGTFCSYEALRDVVKKTKAKSFIDVGCGSGNFSKLLCSMGLRGSGLDFSPSAIEATTKALRQEIEGGSYAVVEGDVTRIDFSIAPVDLGISFMVMEHVEDDVGFVRKLSEFVRADGYLAICVPGRRDCWSFEDKTVGHLRRYDRDDLYRVLAAGGLKNVEVWSVAVPTANLLLRVSNWLVRNSAEAKKVALS